MRARLTPARRARRFAELHRELAALYAEEAEVLEEREREMEDDGEERSEVAESVVLGEDREDVDDLYSGPYSP